MSITPRTQYTRVKIILKPFGILKKKAFIFDIDKIYPKRLQNDSYLRSRLCRALNSEKVKVTLSLRLSGIL